MRSTEKIKKLIKNLNLNVYTNSEADQRVLGELLQAQEKSRKTEPAFASLKIRRKTMFIRKRALKVAAVVAIMICAGGIAVVGVNIGKYIYVGKDDAGVHIFRSEDAKSVVTLDDDEVTDVEQTRNDLQEIEILRQQDKRQLIRVNELFVNGKLDTRVFVYQYQLSDGRTMDMGEGDELNWLLDKKQREEWLQRKKDAGSGEDFGVAEKEFKGCMFVFKRQRFVLSDGTEVIWSVGEPKGDQ